MEHSWGNRIQKERRSPLIVGFGHEAQQGKDTVVNHLIQTFDQVGNWVDPKVRVKRYSFADALKVEVFDFLQGVAFTQMPLPLIINVLLPRPDPAIAYTDELKIAWVDGHKESLRYLLQQWGTEFRRKQNPLYWVNQVKRKIGNEIPNVALLSDMRFLNETGICDVTVRVIREGRLDAVAGKFHASEAELDGFPYHYVLSAKDGDVEGLKRNAEVVFEKILREKDLLPS